MDDVSLVWPSELKADPAFHADVIAGFSGPPRAIPARWLYDRRGSELFEEITRLPEYYPTRTETAMLAQFAPDMAELVGPGRAIVEFGSGSSAKTRHLIDRMNPSVYVPIDISGEFLRQSAEALAADFPKLQIEPVEADFGHPITPAPSIRDLPKLGFFPGSTIGNMVPLTAVNLLRAMVETLGMGSMLLIGIDRIKSTDILIPAYDDAAGVTAAFNLNLLERINRELDGDIPVSGFAHRAIWNADHCRIEMHLEALRPLAFTVAGQHFTMAEGETIHTENSHKYSANGGRLLLRAGGWSPIAEWVDPNGYFAIILAEALPPRTAP